MTHQFKLNHFVLTAFAVLSLAQLSAQAQEKDPWAPFRFLIGSWTGVGSGKPGEALTGSTTFSGELDQKVIIRRNKAEYAPKPGEKLGLVHEDLLVIYPLPGESKYRAIYFDNEGHVINYTVYFPEKERSVAFESEATGKAPRFRLVYELGKDGALAVEFFVAPPGGEFKSYVKGILKRKT